MIINTNLNPADNLYFQQNFKVVNTNVTSLEEADAICLGESHDSQLDRLKNCWLLNQICLDGDSIYLEET